MPAKESISERKTFRRNERLKSRLQIDSLFLQNRTLRIYPFKLVWLTIESQQPFLIKAGFTVPKKMFKRAVHRNLIKRRMRECFRLNKNLFYNQFSDRLLEIHIMLVYIGSEPMGFKESETILKQLFARLIQKVKEQ